MANSVQSVPKVQFNRLADNTAAQTGFTHKITIPFDAPALAAQSAAGDVTFDFPKTDFAGVNLGFYETEESFDGGGITSISVKAGDVSTDAALLAAASINDGVLGAGSGIAGFKFWNDTEDLRVTITTVGAGGNALTQGILNIYLTIVDFERLRNGE